MTHSDERRVALVTGAAQGIGRGIVQRLLGDGLSVWAFDQDADALNDLTNNTCHDYRPHLHCISGDVACEADVAQAIESLREHAGRLDLLVNNAGLAGPFNGPIEDLALADWQRVIDVNLTGQFLMAKHATPMLRACHGSIVNMTSSRYLQSEPQTEAYAASKGGIDALTHALAMSLGPDIRVNAVAPGWIDVRGEKKKAPDTIDPLRHIDHQQHPVGRVGQAADIAGIVAFLASPDAAFITGQTLVADGGMTRKMIYEH